MRYSIGLKIFGIAIFLLVLMVTSALFSTRLAGRVQNQVDAIAEYYVPINGLITNIDVHVLEQEIHLERLKGLYLSDSKDSRTIEEERQAFLKRGEQVDEEIAKALELVRRGLESDEEVVDQIEFARLQPMLEACEREHQHFADLAINLVEILEGGDRALLSNLTEQLVREEEEYNSHIAQIRQELQQFTLNSALQARNDEENVLLLNILITAVSALLGLAFAGIVTVGLVRPVKKLVSATYEVEQGKLDVEVQVASRDEIGTLATTFNHMITELRLKERIKDTFGKYLDPRVVSQLIDSPDDLGTSGEKRIVTVFFSDIAGFTSIAEVLMPDTLVRLINEYFTLQAIPIQQRQGIIDKFIGDSVMAFWGPPFTGENEHARLACLSALEQAEQLEEFRRRLADLMGIRKGLPDFDFRIGIATGEVVVGNIGSELSKSYTVMGDTVNLASRLESANKQYGTRFLISETTQQLAQEHIETREIDVIQVVGKSEPVCVFELLGRKGDLVESQAQLKALFESGLRAYRARDWKAAAQGFEACLELNPEDVPAAVFLGRVDHLKHNPPADDWDGVWRLSQK